MGTYHHVVLRSAAGEYVARVRPSAFGCDVRVGSGGYFDQNVLPAVTAFAEKHFGTSLTPIWVDDMSCDGLEYNPTLVAPWDGPVSLDDEPELPHLVPASQQGAAVRAHPDIIVAGM